MYIFQNALKNIVRNKGRNILLAAIILAIIVTAVVTLMINNTSDRIINEYKSQFGVEVTISPNMSKYQSALQKGQTIAGITPEQYVNFANSELILRSILSNSASCESISLTAVGQSTSNMMGGGYVNTPTMRLLGNNWDDFENGYREVMDDGRMPETKNECIVSMDFAKLNNISVGDMIQILGMILSADEGRVEPDVYNLLVTGIYFDTTDPNGNSIMPSALMNRRNEILTVFETLQVDSAGMSVTATYYLKSPDSLVEFEAELRSKGLDDIYNVSVDEATYEAVVGPIEGMKNVSITFMIVVLILGAVILILLSSIAIRERKYEIGVLRAMGMKKSKVALGLWLEMVTITMLCLIIGMGAGTLLAQPISDTLLAQQIENTQKAEQSTQGGKFFTVIGGSSNESKDDPIDNMSVSLGSDTIFEIILISLLLASSAGITSISKITKYEPIKILMERN